MQLLWEVNPKRRRKARRKLSAKQIAAGFGGGKRRARRRGRRVSARRRRRSAVAAVAAPVVRRRRRRGMRAVSRRRRGGRRSSFSTGSVMSLVKSGVIGGAGAVAVDVAMGYASRMLPPAFATPVDASGQPQYGYFGAKAGIALALGIYGRRLPVVGNYSGRMAEGALTVLAYQFLRPMVPSSIMLGYFNPAPTARASIARVGRTAAYVSGESRGQNMPPSGYIAGMRGSSYRNIGAYEGTGKGAGAAQVVSMVGRGR